MEIAYYDLSGGINLASTKTELGLSTKRIYWSDSTNVEILKNHGIKKQNGNTLLVELTNKEKITKIFEGCNNNLLITTISGKIYNYSNQQLTLINKTINSSNPIFANFLQGTIIGSESDTPFFIDSELNINTCNLKDSNNSDIFVNAIAIYKGRVWLSSGSTIYYSALGTYNDYTTENDAGYISDFHTDTSDIIAIKPYKEYLAIYKNDNIYLLSGNNYEDFAITPFANKGCKTPNAIANVDNKQYFLSNGIFALEQVGELNQIQLGTEISLNIKPELEKLSATNFTKSFCIHYENKHQIWYFFSYSSENYYHTVWIYDYVCKSWFKRVIPQDITTSCIYKSQVLSADNNGNVYIEDFGTTFNGIPISFSWKSPFLSIGSTHHRKMVDEFYFILDEAYENNFDFKVYKDFNSEQCDDVEKIYSVHLEHLIWADNNTDENMPCKWAKDNENIPIWTISAETLEKAEISESNYSIQLCVEGSTDKHSCAIIGLQFREIYNDD